MGLSAEWGMRIKPGEHGLRLSDLNVGIYGEVPPKSGKTRRGDRAAPLPRPGVPPLPYNLRHKHQMWAESAANLYEEAIQRRWIPATDVPWNSLKPLSDDVERAVCQVCTELMQYANTEIEIITYWQDQMSYGYYEVETVPRHRDVRLRAADRSVAQARTVRTAAVSGRKAADS